MVREGGVKGYTTALTLFSKLLLMLEAYHPSERRQFCTTTVNSDKIVTPLTSSLCLQSEESLTL